jgi:hypothetical protein
MSRHSSSSSHRAPLAAILAVPLVVAAILTLFAWPTAKVGPRDLPVGVSGPAAMQQRLDDRFEVHRYASASDARAAIEDREVYGAFVAGPDGPTVLIASAAGPAVAQMLTHAAAEAGAGVEDVVASTPAGGALATSLLPLVLAGLLTGALAAAMTASPGRRAALVAGGSLLAGLAATGIVQGWLDVVEGDWVANAAGLSLMVLAIAALTAGLEALIGRAGILVIALTMVFVGNPFAAVATGPEMLPPPAGAIGQLLPPGAGGNLLRSTGFFDGAGGGEHVAVLAIWALAGLAALAVAGVRRRRPAPAAVPAPA